MAHSRASDLVSQRSHSALRNAPLPVAFANEVIEKTPVGLHVVGGDIGADRHIGQICHALHQIIREASANDFADGDFHQIAPHFRQTGNGFEFRRALERCSMLGATRRANSAISP